MDFKVRILGANSALPKSDSFPSAQVLLYNNSPYLIDCAEGTQVLLRRYKVSFGRIKNIFISHLHGDHFFGIFGLISTLSLLGRKQTLNIYAPNELETIVKSVFKFSNHEMPYKINFIKLDKSEKKHIHEDKNIDVYSFPLIHGIDSFGFLFEEKIKKPNIKKSIISKLNLSVSDILKIKDGSDYTLSTGEVIPNSKLTLPPPSQRKYAYCSDTAFINDLNKYIYDIDLLYHESTFLHKDLDIAEKTGHSTAKQAADAANIVKASKLLIGHFSTRYTNTDIILDEAKQYFKNTQIAKEGFIIDV